MDISRFSKQPKWVQDEIKNLSRERDATINKSKMKY